MLLGLFRVKDDRSSGLFFKAQTFFSLEKTKTVHLDFLFVYENYGGPEVPIIAKTKRANKKICKSNQTQLYIYIKKICK